MGWTNLSLFSRNYLSIFVDYCNIQKGTLNAVRSILMEKKGKESLVIVPMLNAIRTSTETLLLISTHERSRDTFILSRTILETIINTLFILSDSEVVGTRAVKHYQQKVFRDYMREIRMDFPEFRIDPRIEYEPGRNSDIDKLLEGFTSKKGKEFLKWTPESIENRIISIEKAQGKYVANGLRFVSFMIYRHASEIIHGTFFGSLYTLGLTNFRKSDFSQQDLENFQRLLIAQNLEMIGTAIHMTIVAFAEEFNLENEKNSSFNAIKRFVSKVEEFETGNEETSTAFDSH